MTDAMKAVTPEFLSALCDALASELSLYDWRITTVHSCGAFSADARTALPVADGVTLPLRLGISGRYSTDQGLQVMLGCDQATIDLRQHPKEDEDRAPDPTATSA